MANRRGVEAILASGLFCQILNWGVGDFRELLFEKVQFLSTYKYMF